MAVRPLSMAPRAAVARLTRVTPVAARTSVPLRHTRPETSVVDIRSLRVAVIPAVAERLVLPRTTVVAAVDTSRKVTVNMKRWIRAFMPGPACLEQKPMVFAQEARHLRRRGTSCAWIHMRGPAGESLSEVAR